MTAVWQLFTAFFQIGLFSIGGGYAIIPLIQEQVVDHYGWISQRVFSDIITISQMTPGPLAVNTSTFVGIRIAGIPGALAATAGCILSGVCISLLLYRLLQKNHRSACVRSALQGMKSASVGLIASAAATIVLLALLGPTPRVGFSMDWASFGMLLASLLVMRKRWLGPIALMLTTGALGLLFYGFG